MRRIAGASKHADLPTALDSGLQAIAETEKMSALWTGAADCDGEPAWVESWKTSAEPQLLQDASQDWARQRCGTGAAATILSLMEAEPVNLEPSPVSMLAMRGSADALVTADEVSHDSASILHGCCVARIAWSRLRSHAARFCRLQPSSTSMAWWRARAS